jgi:aspartate/methionine/tyrosine aminotransferase
MDFRKDLSVPGEPPFQATVANYTSNYILLLSSSKAFSYAGQRTGVMIISGNFTTGPIRIFNDIIHLTGLDTQWYTALYIHCPPVPITPHNTAWLPC